MMYGWMYVLTGQCIGRSREVSEEVRGMIVNVVCDDGVRGVRMILLEIDCD
jgi:hypothetical protein